MQIFHDHFCVILRVPPRPRHIHKQLGFQQVPIGGTKGSQRARGRVRLVGVRVCAQCAVSAAQHADTRAAVSKVQLNVEVSLTFT